jgi:ligand-binding sensor domain-containing protein
MKIFAKAFAMLLAGWLAVPASALDPGMLPTQYILHTWQVEQGLPQNSVEAILQDKDGFLWLGTQEGLVRFDGMAFTVFDRQTTKDLRNNHVLALLQGRDGSLWIGTYGGLTRYQSGRFTHYGTNSGLKHPSILVLFEDGRGRL